jgi:GT2 family glycosyltransferase
MLVSVVIAARDRPRLLREAVESVRRQTYPVWELVIIDDGSDPPLSFDDLRLMLGERVHLVRHAVPRGIPAAKNAGLRVAKGDLVLHLDDDDLLLPSALQRVIAAFHAHPDLECLFLNVAPFGRFASTAVTNQERALRRVMTVTRGEEIAGLTKFGPELFEALVKTVPIAFQRPVARREAWERVGGHRETLFSSEPNWALRASLRLRCALLHEPVSRWRVDGQNYASRPEFQERNIKTLIACSRDLIEWLAHENNIPHRYLAMARMRLADHCFALAAYLHENGRPGTVRAVLQGLRAAPRFGLKRLLASRFLRSAITRWVPGRTQILASRPPSGAPPALAPGRSRVNAPQSTGQGIEMESIPKISVICWVDRDNPVLETTLRAYMCQRGDPDDFELIVADTDEGIDWSKAIQTVADDNPAMAANLRYLRTPFSGRAERNNFSVEQSRGPLLLFVSADFVPVPDFIQAHLAFHRDHPEDECVGIGPVRSPEDQRAASEFLTWIEDTGNIFGVDFKAEVPELPAKYFYCGNASLKRSFFLRVGGFDPDFPYDAGDDFEFGLRAAKHGLRSHLVTGAKAMHNHPFTFADRRRRMELAGRSAALLASKYPDREQRIAPLWRQRFWFYQTLIQYSLTRSKQHQVRYWKHGLSMAFARGYFSAGGRIPRLVRPRD